MQGVVMMGFLRKKTSQAIILFIILTVVPQLYSSGYRLSAYQAAENHFSVKGKDPELFDKVEHGWGTVFLFDTKEVPHTVLSHKTFGFLWRAPAATRALAFDDAVKTVGWMRYFHKNDAQVTVFAVRSSDPDVAYIEAGPLEHRTRKIIEPESHVIFYWPEYWHDLTPSNINQLNAVALSAEGETLYEYRYSEENAFRNGEPRFYPTGKGMALDSQIQIKSTEEKNQPTAEELGICYHDYGIFITAYPSRKYTSLYLKKENRK